MVQTLFYISHNGQEIGPLSLEEIRQNLLDEKISELDYIYVEEREDWLVLGEYLKEEQEGKTPIVQPETERRKPSTPVLLSFDDFNETSLDEKTQDTQVLHQSFSLEGGSADIVLEELRPGKVEILVALEGDQATHREELKVQGGEPFEIRVDLSATWKAPEDKILTFDVVDEFGELCSEFRGSINIQLDGGSPVQISLKGGRTEHLLECHKAGSHTLELLNCVPSLRHPETLSLEIEPGEPTSLKVQSDSTARAGQPHKVRIQAFDAFGNLATYL